MNDTPEEPADLTGLEVKDSSAKAEAEQASKAILQAIADLKAENADLRDKNLRIIAEMENFRRRAERDKAEGVKYAASEFGRDIISVADNLRRAIEAVSNDAKEQNPAVKTLIEGVEATERELLKTFERHGITRFDPLGEKFDPHFHEAVVKVDAPNVPADVIVQVLQAGYKISDRVLRPATVILSKGGVPGKPVDKDRDATSADRSDDHGPDIAHDHDPDIVRNPSGAAKEVRREATVTRPVTEGAGPEKDDLVSSFGKRLDNGN